MKKVKNEGVAGKLGSGKCIVSERLNNVNFKSVEFDRFKSEAGYDIFWYENLKILQTLQYMGKCCIRNSHSSRRFSCRRGNNLTKFRKNMFQIVHNLSFVKFNL